MSFLALELSVFLLEKRLVSSETFEAVAVIFIISFFFTFLMLLHPSAYISEHARACA